MSENDKKGYTLSKTEKITIDEIKSLKGTIGVLELDLPKGDGDGSVKINGKEVSNVIVSMIITIRAQEAVMVKAELEVLKGE